ncbi:MAG: hypothetical protein AAFQ98_24310 [Bacteroidota bacterium]
MKRHGLSPDELECLRDDQFLLTKRKVVEKNVALLYQLQEPLQDWKYHLPKELKAVASESREGKVSIGENYRGLPYQIFDFPRVFKGENTLALRTMIWWGKYFSVVLHLAGEPWQMAQSGIITNVKSFSNHYVGVGEDPWEHHFDPDNFRSINSIQEEELPRLRQRGFFKIGQRWPLEEREFLLERVMETANQWLRLFDSTRF